MSSGDDVQKKKRMTIIAVSSCMLVAMVVAVTVGVHLNQGEEETTNANRHSEISPSMKAIKSICAPTDYKKTCEESLQSEAGNSTTDTNKLIGIAFQVAKKHIAQAVKNSTLLQEVEKDSRGQQALGVCKQLLNQTIGDLEKIFQSFGKIDDLSKVDKILADLKIWLSATITNQQTCLDGFHDCKSNSGEKMKNVLKTAMELSKNGLAIITEMSTVVKEMEGTNRRRLLQELPVLGHGEFPAWFENTGVRRLLKASRTRHHHPNVVVAKDGSGKYLTIAEALRDIPLNSTKPFVIYIKQGVYAEHLVFAYNMHHVVLIGDGAEKTRITGHLNYVDGTNTFNTATVSINSDYFMAKNIGFENSAGAIKHQAVALLAISDYSVFYNCSFDGYQDTLYVHSKRQFFRNCNISGTIDFVFGDAAAVFQKCNFFVRQPLDNQQAIVTAHAKSDERATTGLVIQNSSLIPAEEFAPNKKKFPVYLGRPWGMYSKTIIMESYIDDMIHPEGWMRWDGPWGVFTCFYSEYNNYGPGANTSARAAWKGVRTLTPQSILPYTPKSFIQGDFWLPQTGVPYNPSLFNKSGVAAAAPH